MNCNDVQKFIYVYLDEEFDKGDTLEFEAHIRECDKCRGLCEFEERFRRRLRNQLTMRTAPPSLRLRILDALDDPNPAVPELREAATGTHQHAVRWVPMALAAGVATLVLWPYPTAYDSALPSRPGLGVASVLGVGGASQGSAPASDAQSLSAPDDSTSSVIAAARSLVEEAVETHQVDPPMDVVGDSKEVGSYISRRMRVPMMAPLPETFDTRMVGARLLRTGIRPTTMFTYDHLGRRMTVVQRLMHRQSCPVELAPRMPHVVFEKAGRLNVAVMQGDGVVTAVVSDMPEKDLANVIPSNYSAAFATYMPTP